MNTNAVRIEPKGEEYPAFPFGLSTVKYWNNWKMRLDNMVMIGWKMAKKTCPRCEGDKIILCL